MSKKTTNLIIAVMMLLGIIAIVFIKLNYATRPAVNTVKAIQSSIADQVSLDGTVKAQKEAELGFANVAPGKVKMLNHKVGDFVKAGTILAQLDDSDARAQYQQAVQAAQAARADLAQYQANLEAQKYRLKSLKNNDATFNDKNVQKAQIDASENIIDAQTARISAAEEGVKNMVAQLAKNVIRAPFDGIITKQDVEVGEIISPSKAVLTLVGNGDVFEIQVQVSEQDMAKIKVGDQASVTLDAYGKDEKFDAKVSAIDPQQTLQNGIVTNRVTLEFMQKDERIKSGMQANVVLEAAAKSNVIIIPEKAIIVRGQKQFVLTLQNGTTQEKEIVTGVHGSDAMVEVLSGVKAGDNIVL